MTNSVSTSYVANMSAANSLTSVSQLPQINPFQVLIDVTMERIMALMGLMAEAAGSMQQSTNAELNAQKMSNEVNSLITDSEDNSNKSETLPSDIVDYINDNQIMIDGVTTGLPDSNCAKTGDIAAYSVAINGVDCYISTTTLSSTFIAMEKPDTTVTFSGPHSSKTFATDSRGNVSVNGEPVSAGDYSITYNSGAANEGINTFVLGSGSSQWTESTSTYNDEKCSSYITFSGPGGSVTMTENDDGGVTVDNQMVWTTERSTDFTSVNYDDTFTTSQLEAIKGEFDVEATSYADSTSQTQLTIQEVAQSFSMCVSEIS